ncbi:hypothetical protein AAVH_09720 [Aphelenchoides avenae]|nr:hypothetical protein AAVH_09720 [Aphelenchus avenae]
MPKNFAKAPDETSTITGFIPMGQTVAEVTVEVRRQDLCTTVKISSASDRLVKDLVAGLHRRILLHLSRVWRRPKDQLSLPPTISFSGDLQPLWKDVLSYWR